MSDQMNPNDLRIGVYVCHCGTNISNVINCESVAEKAKKMAGVTVSRDYKYMCSDLGQELVQKDIREHGLNRVVVASCSPLLHEETFRSAIWKAGLNPFFFQMVNIREHGSWVHTDKEAATAKAEDLILAAVKRVAHHKALEKKKVPVNPTALVVGGGIAGIHTALTLANAGKKVILVEKEPTIGGHMAKFDKTFPTLDCAACILTPKMTSVKSHPNITLWTYSEVTNVEGFVGNYKVSVKRKNRFVVEENCIGCNDCIDACVYKEPKFTDEFDEGLSKRKPVYFAGPQAVPHVVTIDPKTCIQVKTGKCKMPCVTACGDKKAIDFSLKEKVEEIEVGTIVLATGFKTFDAKRKPEYGYGVYPNVYTSLEVERLVNSSGPTGGNVILKDGSKPKAIGIVHCVGSRDVNTNRHCSRVCCMYSLKLAHLMKEKTGAEVYNFYIDIRTPGKGFEEFYDQLLQDGVHFIRGRVAEVSDCPSVPEEEGKLIIRAEDTLMGAIRRIPVDMMILATGLEAREDADDVRRRFNISCSKGGFFLERHPKLAPVNTFTDGIFLAGACQGPKDIPDTVAQAGAAAAEALVLIDKGHVEIEPNTAYVRAEDCCGCKTCISLCPYSAITRNEEEKRAEINEALCKGCGTCVAACPSGSIVQNLFEDEEISEEIKGVLTHA